MSKLLSGSKNAGGLVALVIAGVIALISTGQIQVPLPSPANGKVIHVVPENVLPWRPQPLQGRFAPNTHLHSAVRLFEGRVLGAESVAVRPNGDLTLLDRYGNLFEAPLSRSSSSSGHGSSSWELQEPALAWLGPGRPLGYHFDAKGDLIVCDSLKGLVKYDYARHEVSVLAARVSRSSAIDPGSEITYANDLTIAQDGKIYFTSCSDIVPAVNEAGYYDTFKAYMLGLAQGLPKGKLLMYDPATKETVVLAKGFHYANGVALSADESYLVLAETDRIRLVKYWLKGPKAGTSEPLIERLPGPPDGVSTAPDGNFWVGLVSPIPPIAALLRDPTVRALYVWLPAWLKPPLKNWGAVAKVSGKTGEVLDFLMDPTGTHVASVSAAVEHDGKLFLGNLAGNYVSYFDLKAPRNSSSSMERRSPGIFAAAHDVDWLHGDEAAAYDDSYHDDYDAANPDLEGSCPGSGATGEDHSPADSAVLWIHGKVAHSKVLVFSKSYCPYSMKAKNALLTLIDPAQMEVVELDQLSSRPLDDGGRFEASDVQDALERVTGARTVPRVFIGEKFIGGGDDTDRMAKSGKLKKALLDAGVALKISTDEL